MDAEASARVADTANPCAGKGGLGHGQIGLMAGLCALSAGSLYYSQVMAQGMAGSFGVAPSAVGLLSFFGHAGYVAGLVLLVPLGDRVEKRSIVSLLAALSALALLAAALAPSFALEALAATTIGLFSTTASLTVPMAATLAAPERRGQAVGRVMLGLLLGIVASRLVSGAVTQAVGWRAMFLLAAASQLGAALLVRRYLPRVPATTSQSYRQLLASLRTLYAEEPQLRLAAWRGALLFGAFSAFWATFALHLLQAHPGWGATAAGVFGVAGLAGALIAPVIGRRADQQGPDRVLDQALFCLFAALVLLAAFPDSTAGQLLAIVLFDMGIQAAMICNQTIIYALRPSARTRINSVYMIIYFAGGTCGTAAAVSAWNWLGWNGVLGGCFLFVLAGTALHARARVRTARRDAP
jgi:predicted MFS family arabinose efflux permease